MLRRALLVCVLALPAAPASSIELAFLAPADLGGAEARPVAPLLSAQGLAVQAALAAQDASAGDPREQALLEDIRSFYAARDYSLLWFSGNKPTPGMTALRRYMDRADEHGLDPAPYAQHLSPQAAGDPQRLAEADVEFSRTIARFVTHLSSGRIRPADVSSIITLEPEIPPVGDVLNSLAEAVDMEAALARYEPPHQQYAALKAKLSELYSSPADDRIVIAEGTLLKPGETDERAPQLRMRLRTILEEGVAADVYDDRLVEAVIAFQEKSGLNGDGILGPRTLTALNGHSREDDIAAIIANMERWRWMPRDLGAFHVTVNVPEFMVRVVDDGAVVHETRVVVGTAKNRTPTFSHVMDHVIVNPYWNVPASIVAEEMLPEARRNRGYFPRGGYEVFARVRGRYRQINPYWVDWYRVSPRAIQVRQVPGDFNALGRIKFMFPNQHSVYLHDTPSKKLFQRDQRAFSHGCVRVENPLAFADAILPVTAPEWNSGRLESLYGGKERRINFDTPVPVHLAYFTMAIDADGEMRRFEDIYGYDEETTALMQPSPEG